jgi:hypothetical protein
MASMQVVNSAKLSNTSITGCSDEPLLSDGRLRRVFKRVIALRNREGVMP